MLALLLTAALIFFAIWHVSSWGRKREGEAAPPQPRVAADPRSALLRPRRSASRDGAGRCARSRPARRRSDAPPGPGAGRARWAASPGPGRATRTPRPAGRPWPRGPRAGRMSSARGAVMRTWRQVLRISILEYGQIRAWPGRILLTYFSWICNSTCRRWELFGFLLAGELWCRPDRWLRKLQLPTPRFPVNHTLTAGVQEAAFQDTSVLRVASYSRSCSHSILEMLRHRKLL
jgi:hypothetical protein